MLDGGVPAAFENVQKTDDIAIDVGVGILERMAHTRLSRQMYDPIWRFALEHFFDSCPVGNVGLDEAETLVPGQPRQSRLLQGNVVVVVEVVQAQNIVAAREQPLRDMHPDESRRSCDPDFQMTISSATRRTEGN